MNSLDEEERLAFSARLRLAMANAHIPIRPSVLAREFNRRAGGMEVTSHAARKWLVGEAFPSQPRLLALAAWLEVQVAWLRFGTLEIGQSAGAQDRIASGEQLRLLQDIAALSGPARALVRDLVQSLRQLEAGASEERTRAGTPWKR